jgi:hypothetical protein
MNSQHQSEVVQRQQRPPRPPGILTLLPEALTYYPYADSNDVGRNNRHKKRGGNNNKRCHQTSNTADEAVISNNNIARSDDNNSTKEENKSTNQGKQQNSIITIEEFGCRTEIIPDHSLHLTINTDDGNTINKNGFTLFFFVDSNNRQSLNAIPIVSRWYHYVLSNGGHSISDDDDNIIQEEYRSSSGNRIIFVPNQPSSHEINLHNSNTDSILQASINASSGTGGSATKGHVTISIIQHTGFYHLPFLHKSRLPLLHLLGVTRVPSIIVVSNATGRVVTRYGWEAIEREGGPGGLLERWIDMSRLARKKDDDDDHDETSNLSMNCFESKVLSDWKCGKSGLPLWWHVLSFIL